jgi:hypothetical protein
LASVLSEEQNYREGIPMSEGDLPPSATVTYEFRDASVPPPYHRSFVLVFDRSQARIVVDSYGDVLADRTAPVSEQVWNRVLQGFPAIHDLALAEPEQPCTGGTGFSATVTADGAVRFALSGLACGGVNSAAADRLAEWVEPVQSLFPPMAQLAPE